MLQEIIASIDPNLIGGYISMALVDEHSTTSYKFWNFFKRNLHLGG